MPFFKVVETADENGKVVRAELMVRYAFYSLEHGHAETLTEWMKVPRIRAK